RVIRADLCGLLDVERLPRLIELQRRALKVHAELRGPHRGSGRSGAPPNSITKTLGVRLKAQQPRGVREHGARIRLGKALATQQIEERLCMPASQLSVGLSVVKLEAEMPPA